jgi:acetate kinase
MQDHLLTLNAGSSSIKYALFECAGDLAAPALADQIGGLGTEDATLTHSQAMKQVLERVSGFHVVAVGHRIVHGGTTFSDSVLIDNDVLRAVAQLSPLAPLHQRHNLAGVHSARGGFPGVPQVGCFDTAFHRTQPEVNRHFALPQALHESGIQRYGFHGLSYESIRAQLMAADAQAAQGRIVIAHLGNGASMCAMHECQSVATTMSFSPLDGLPMGTRCGRLDAAVVLHLLEHEGRSAENIGQLLYRESGLLGLSSVSSDMRELLASNAPGAQLAIDYFVEHSLRELAAMAAALRGIDGLVFTGGIGENAAALRARIVEGAKWLGMQIDAGANERGAGRISAAGSSVWIDVLRTNEEAVIARHTARCAGLLGSPNGK